MNLEIPDKYKKEKLAICPVYNPTAIAYANIYEEGDLWIKINSCKGCPEKSRKKCCGRCPLKTQLGCVYQLGINKKRSKKPFFCVHFPVPDKCFSWCQLEFLCVEGKYKDKIRKIKNPGNIFSNNKEN